MARKPKYLFRGTSLGWKGNKASRNLPRTSTTTNPLKAILFALACRRKGGTPVIYMTTGKSLKGLNPDKNCIAVLEQEQAWEVTPEEYEKLCEGYITLDDASKILQKMTITIPVLVDISLFDDTLGTIKKVRADTINQFYELAQPLIKK